LPLLLDHKIDDHTRVAVWKVEEPTGFFLAALSMSDEEQDNYAQMKPHRQLEWLSSRYLLHLVSGDKQRTMITKTELGKPCRDNCPKHISISHSKNYTAVIISSKRVGVDIQAKEKKIGKIAHKFISKQETKRLDVEHLEDSHHIFWGAKEAMYKAYGLKELAFKKHMHLYPFEVSDGQLEIVGWVRKNAIAQDYNITINRVEDTYLVTAILAQEK